MPDFLSELKTAHRLIRMTVVGDGAVGKTTLVQALLKKTKESNHNDSNGIFLEEKKINRTPFMEIESWSYKDLVFQCYDLAGQRTPGTHPLDVLKHQVLKYIDIFIFVFSLDRYESFDNLHNWLQLMNTEYNIKDYSPGLILVGNKVDLGRNVSRELVQTLVGEDRFFHTYVETSSIYGIGIQEILDKIVNIGLKRLNLYD
ncbi:MAG: GTPase domain-containing protein [Candidatus Lokiarchaeia archaeon]|nr:GTPase domain-containing protein [Candidatus Lokiarchaeia archaeon]